MENPFNKTPIQAGFLSFLLPGLGQLFQQRFLIALLFFLLYIGVLTSSLRLWIFVPMAVSAWEAQRLALAGKAQWNSRVLVYFFVGTVAFFSSFSLLAERALPYAEQGKISAIAEHLAEEIDQCAVQQKRMPHSLANALETCPQVKWQKDPWGNPFVYEMSAGGFEIRSLGRDGRVATEDDFVYRFPLPASFRQPGSQASELPAKNAAGKP